MPKKAASSSRKVKAPAAVGATTTQSSPLVQSNGTAVVITHRELFSTLVSDASGGTIFGWTIQPGYSECFPWLAQIAQNYEKYEFMNLSFEFISRCSTSQVGMIVLSYDQDPDDSFPTEDENGRRRMMASPGAVCSNAWNSVKFAVPAAVLKRIGERFIRSVGETTTVEPRTADAGLLWAGLFGVGSGTMAGDLFVSYKVRLSIPQIVSEGTTAAPRAVVAAPSVVGNTERPSELVRPLTALSDPTGSWETNDDDLSSVTVRGGTQRGFHWTGPIWNGLIELVLPHVWTAVGLDPTTLSLPRLFSSFASSLASSLALYGYYRFVRIGTVTTTEVGCRKGQNATWDSWQVSVVFQTRLFPGDYFDIDLTDSTLGAWAVYVAAGQLLMSEAYAVVDPVATTLRRRRNLDRLRRIGATDIEDVPPSMHRIDNGGRPSVAPSMK